MRFSKVEVGELIKAWFFISLAFTILFGGVNIFSQLTKFFILFLISGFTVGLAFLFHELAHKFMAGKYGYRAEFRAFDKMLFLAVLFSFFGFIIAAPGAVMIRAFNISKEKNGKISLAGPLTNIIFASLFLLILFLFKPSGLAEIFFDFGFRINALLAFFNLLPIPSFDGRKVLEWDKNIYLLFLIISLVLFFLSYFI